MLKKLSCLIMFIFLLFVTTIPVYASKASQPNQSPGITIEIPVQTGKIIFKNIKLITSDYGSYLIGEYSNDSNLKFSYITFNVTVYDATNRQVCNTSISNYGLKLNETKQLGYNEKGEYLTYNLAPSPKYTIDIKISSSNYSGFEAVDPSKIISFKANWIGQQARFNQSSSYSSVYEKIDSDSYQSSIDLKKLQNLTFTIVDLYQKFGNSGITPEYYWKLVDSKGYTVWYKDSYYGKEQTYSMLSQTPFLLGNEIQQAQNNLNSYKDWIGTSLWINKNKSYSLKLPHLEHVTIQDVHTDTSYKKVHVDLATDNGDVVTWTYNFYSKDDLVNTTKTFEEILSRAFLVQNPYELYPEWSDDVWDNIKQQYVVIGWDKEKCIMSWGRPKDVNKSIGSWGVHEQWVYGIGSYLYFDNGILSSIQN